MKAYKLMKLRKNGTLGSLFIDAKTVYPIGEWLEAEFHPTKGFAERFGWHCCYEMIAPHLSKDLKSGEHRVWVEVEVEGCTRYERPESQGGAWLLADRMMIVKIIG